MTYSLVADGQHGHVVISAGGAFTYTPNANYNGADSFSFKANDGQVDSNVAAVTLTIAAVNDAPVSGNGSASINEDTPLAGALPTASDVEGDPIVYALAGAAAHGAAVVNADGTFSYTPNPNYNGPDSFSFSVADNHGGTNTYAYAITIAAVNDPPLSANGSASINEDTPLTGSLPAASDADGDPITYALAGAAAHGVAVVNADGTFSYTPGANYNGSDTFGFSVSDGHGGTNTYAYSITIAPVNDPPVSANGSASINEDTPLSGALPAASDVEGDPITYALAAAATNGVAVVNANGTFSYTPNANYNGSDGFSFSVSDNHGGTNTYAYSITIAPVDDAPVAANGSASGNEDTAITGQASASDVDSPSLTYSVVSGPAHGVLTLQSNGAFSYAPTANYNGSDSFTFKANDGSLNSNTATVSLTINPVNDPPVTTADTTAASTSGSVSIPVATLLANDTDVDGDALSIVSVAMGATPHGVVQLSGGVVTYTPNVGYTGTDTFTYAVTDGHVPTPVNGTVTVTITTQTAGYAPGTAGNDVFDFTGRIAPQQVNSAAGNDTVTGGSGADSLNGSTGNDVIIGAGGADSITGGAGSDTMTGGSGNDTFYMAKGDLVPTASGAVYDYVTDFERSGGGSLFHDTLRLSGFTAAATLAYVSDPSAGIHDYLVTDGAFTAHILVGYAGAGVNLIKNNDYFITA